MRLILCRHGETDFNKAKKFQGWLETELNEKGLKQAKAVADLLKDEKIDYIISSPQIRARQTVKEIAKHHSSPLLFRDELKEIDTGNLSGLSPNEILKKFPGEWEKRVEDKYNYKHFGGESYNELDTNKVQPLLEEFREKYWSRNLIVVTHQGTGRLIIGNLLGLDDKGKMSIDIPNDCIYFIEYGPHKTKIGYKRALSGDMGEGFLKKPVDEITP